MIEHDLGPQPLDALMTTLGIANADLVKVSTEQLSFKMVQKARKGRRLSPHVKMKVLRAFQLTRSERLFSIQELFNY